MKVLVTGCSGTIGTVLSRGLLGRFSIRGFDLIPSEELEDCVTGDVADFNSVMAPPGIWMRSYTSAIPLRRKAVTGITY